MSGNCPTTTPSQEVMIPHEFIVLHRAGAELGRETASIKLGITPQADHCIGGNSCCLHPMESGNLPCRSNDPDLVRQENSRHLGVYNGRLAESRRDHQPHSFTFFISPIVIHSFHHGRRS